MCSSDLGEKRFPSQATFCFRPPRVVVSFKASAYFKSDSAKMNPKAIKEMTRFSKLIFLLPNKIQIEGHTEKTQPENWDSTWELAGARASKVARFFIENGLDPTKLTVKSFGSTRPRFRESSPTQRILNNRVEVNKRLIEKSGVCWVVTLMERIRVSFSQLCLESDMQP